MPPSAVLVTTGSRLHFGMFSFGQPDVPQFGGVGVMIDAPSTQVRLRAASEISADGPLAAAALHAAHSATRSPWFSALAGCQIEVLRAAPPHAGLGSGTQLALAVAAGMHALAGGPGLSAEALAQAAGRGQRSAIGLHGFLQGGLIVEAGKRDQRCASPVISRVALPDAWRFVLLRPPGLEGLSGEAERRAFEQLPQVPHELTARMCREALLDLVPAAMDADCARFGESLFRFGQDAGACFAPLQGGAYADAAIDELVTTLRQYGVHGVGQSSWGPTVFAVLSSKGDARALVDRLRDARWGGEATIARACNTPARIEMLAP